MVLSTAHISAILTIDYYQSKFKSRFTITKYASGVDGATPSDSHGRPRPAVDSPILGFMYVISPLARTHRSNAQLDQRPSGIAGQITFLLVSMIPRIKCPQ